MKILSNKWFKFAIAAIIYILWVIWLGNFFFIPGIAVIYDIYISKKVNWAFWKKRDGNNNAFIEWLDALIFAVIAVTLINIFLFQNYRIPTGSMEKSLLIGDHLFVSKVAYGPRLPNTPIAFPFTQHTMPVTGGKSWLNIIQRPYKRLAGFRQIKRNDPVVFNFPAGDTVVLENQVTSYYEIVRQQARQLRDSDLSLTGTEKSFEEYYNSARQLVNDRFNVIYRPVDRRDNYVKRCVALPGDSVEVRNGILFINGEPVPDNGTQQTTYWVTTNGTAINPKAFERMNISRADQQMMSGSLYLLPLTKDNKEKIASFINVTEINEDIRREGQYLPQMFPHNENYPWNEDNYGPIWIPKKGSSVNLDTSNIHLFQRIIDVYEENDLSIKDGKIYINGSESTTYTFSMDYYWMMGDNRHFSADSRFWGPVPEDHIVGKPVFIWLSLDKEAKGLRKIRFNRFFKIAR